MTTLDQIKINTEQGLYIIPCHGGGYSSLGFAVALRRGAAVAEWLKREGVENAPETPKPELAGTVEGYGEYLAIMEAGAAFSARTGKRCPAELTPEFIGREGERVEVTGPGGYRERFYIGRSGGWMPCHLEIKTRRSMGGGAVYIPEGGTVRWLGTRR